MKTCKELFTGGWDGHFYIGWWNDRGIVLPIDEKDKAVT